MRGGFTLAEVMVATAVSSVVSIMVLAAMVGGMHLFKSNSSEMLARDKGSRVIRRISTDMQQAIRVNIYPTYLGTGGAASEYGSCIVLQPPNGGQSVTYYSYASSSDPNSGGIYYDANAATAPNPGSDKLLLESVQGLEFRRDVTGTVRVGFAVGTYGYPSLQTGSKEPDRVRFSTSVLPRN